jgi:endonuclease/exonuclease/phosphatase family metal-dependent hydrolase
MTRNMDAGTDLNYVTAPGADFITGLLQTVAEVDASRIPERAEQLAAEIDSVRPDLIALQEVTFWSIEDSNGPRVYDQLALLMKALDTKGLHYRLAVAQTLTDILVPIPGFLNIRFTDHNAILVRSDLPPGHLDVMGTESHLFENQLPPFVLPGGQQIPIPNGWIAVEVKVRGARFKFVNTHLLSAFPAAISQEAFNLTEALQMAQAGELLTGLSSTSLPVILAGDFNSDAQQPQHAPDNTGTAALIANSGYGDAWHLTHSADPGYTWPLFFEDQLSPFPTVPFERIDLIFSNGPVPSTVELSGLSLVPTGVLASDHLGVVAEFDLENHRPDVQNSKK